MRGLNRKQREFLVDIASKVIVYLTTITMIGHILGKKMSPVAVPVTVLSIIVLLGFSLILLKED